MVEIVHIQIVIESEWNFDRGNDLQVRVESLLGK